MPARRLIGYSQPGVPSNSYSGTTMVAVRAQPEFSGIITEVEIYPLTAGYVKVGLYRTDEIGTAYTQEVVDNAGTQLLVAGEWNVIDINNLAVLDSEWIAIMYQGSVAGVRTGFPISAIASQYFANHNYAGGMLSSYSSGTDYDIVDYGMRAIGWIAPTTASVNGSTGLTDGDTLVPAVGTDFMPLQGTGKIYLTDNVVFASSTVVEEQTATTWLDSLIQFTVKRGALPDGAVYFHVVTDLGLTTDVGFEKTISGASSDVICTVSAIRAGRELDASTEQGLSAIVDATRAARDFSSSLYQSIESTIAANRAERDAAATTVQSIPATVDAERPARDFASSISQQVGAAISAIRDGRDWKSDISIIAAGSVVCTVQALRGGREFGTTTEQSIPATVDAERPARVFASNTGQDIAATVEAVRAAREWASSISVIEAGTIVCTVQMVRAEREFAAGTEQTIESTIEAIRAVRDAEFVINQTIDATVDATRAAREFYVTAVQSIESTIDAQRAVREFESGASQDVVAVIDAIRAARDFESDIVLAADVVCTIEAIRAGRDFESDIIVGDATIVPGARRHLVRLYRRDNILKLKG